MPPKVLRRVAFSLHRRHAPSVPGPGAFHRRRGHLCLSRSATVALLRPQSEPISGDARGLRSIAAQRTTVPAKPGQPHRQTWLRGWRDGPAMKVRPIEGRYSAVWIRT